MTSVKEKQMHTLAALSSHFGHGACTHARIKARGSIESDFCPAAASPGSGLGTKSSSTPLHMYAPEFYGGTQGRAPSPPWACSRHPHMITAANVPPARFSIFL
eukprot:CAMPEP_0179338488 /NCGR_PEP_ID=MMETSP0797-20121207/68205_1 /TAXON_ID=47934 /ORGANISM="Dinophysis acuminata, Strain DAEP01" /LENGTH=102 /DNA_ID=CAMNT_0021052249 /DNA_START=340 /DNA_END=643 /DNA_ORIENTATION=-